MAQISNGILGKVTGKVGGVVTSTWYGKNVVKAYNPSPRNPKTEAQTAQRSLFAIIVAMLKVVLPTIKAGFKAVAINMPAWNYAVKFALDNALFLGRTVDTISFLDLAVNSTTDKVTNVTGEDKGNSLGFTLPDLDNTGGDKLTICIYNPSSNTAINLVDVLMVEEGSEQLYTSNFPANTQSGDMLLIKYFTRQPVTNEVTSAHNQSLVVTF